MALAVLGVRLTAKYTADESPKLLTPNTTAKVESCADLQTKRGTLRGIRSLQRGDRFAIPNCKPATTFPGAGNYIAYLQIQNAYMQRRIVDLQFHFWVRRSGLHVCKSKMRAYIFELHVCNVTL